MSMGTPFVFNGIASERYGVSLAFIENDETKANSGGGRTFTTMKAPRSARNSIINVSQDQPLSFDVEIVFDTPADLHRLTAVKTWLGSPLKFSKLYICAEQFDDYYYNCYFTLGTDYIYADGYDAISATITCDAPWAWEEEKTVALPVGTFIAPKLYKFENISEDAEPMKPIISFRVTQDGELNVRNPSLVIRNIQRDSSGSITYDRTTIFASDDLNQTLQSPSDATKTISFTVTGSTQYKQNEVITLDNETAILHSSIAEPYRAGNFNKIFLKIPQGRNELYIYSSFVDSIKMTYSNAKRLGGGWY